ncbi:MAG: hypothetical protein UY72_C0009G0002 [Candidatus Uhrbacteria bacterium GW2011_GWD2_52_7]|uniref:Uncharacterized protein n=1 Tax=Candidatus Uhrbacteria bacterium GW2011_GWD2_52_7 TaxID=1618989 RepID=A0A0G2ADL3_9BACT|nr:MAG: hypothetical protein UY72_C0009G0002 [Candidatus Uhrbacteria bacterium GW2011_GWD2_52_7]
MLESFDAKDMLFMVLALCALWFTMFLCWVLYQAAMLMKRVHALVDEVRLKVEDLIDGIGAIRMRVEGHVASLSNIADGIKKIMDALRSRDRM